MVPQVCKYKLIIYNLEITGKVEDWKKDSFALIKTIHISTGGKYEERVKNDFKSIWNYW